MTITSNVFAPISLRDFIRFCHSIGWTSNDVRGLSRLYRKLYPRNCQFVVKHSGFTIGKPFPTYAEARSWALWNYKGNVKSFRIVPFDPAGRAHRASSGKDN